MKKQIFIVVILLLTTSMLFATHNKAGEIQVIQLDFLRYEAVIKTYTQFSSTNVDRDSLEICWGDGACEWVQRNNSDLLENDTRFNAYTAQHIYTNEGDYTISMTDNNRNGGIANINGANSDNVAFHIETNFTASATINNPPLFLNPPNLLIQS